MPDVRAKWPSSNASDFRNISRTWSGCRMVMRYWLLQRVDGVTPGGAARSVAPS
ncbi:MAG: hypothetical protein MZV64_29545 [Ignavibacteriales bacterium]|nr:hypothetical protein [Ignavibacteriales bacterium]